MEIAPGIHSIPFATRTIMGMHMGMYAPNVYLVAGQSMALIDSGYGRKKALEARLKYIQGLAPLKLAYILLTHHHTDHVGGVEAIRAATGARVLLHSQPARSKKKVVADGTLKDGDAFDLGGVRLEIIHTPGHTPGSVCIYIREREVLFSGDHILGIGTTVVRRHEGDMAQYIESLRKLLGLPINLICPGHGPAIREPGRKVEELIAHRLEREQQLLSYLKQGKKEVSELVAEIYPELDKKLEKMAKWQVEAHLAKLVSEGKVTVSKRKYSLK